MSIPFHYSDGGRSDAGFHDEEDDCVVRAFALATGVDYKRAHAAFEREGRSAGRGCMAGKLVSEVAARLGIRVGEIIRRDGGPVIDFVYSHPKNSYILNVPGHAFAVRDGVVYDLAAPKPRGKIKRAWKILSEPAC